MARSRRRGPASAIMATITVMAATGCGAASKAATRASTLPAARTTAAFTARAPRRRRSTELRIHFAFTNEEGWRYNGTVPFPQRRVIFSKNVSSSPPGFARIKMEMTGKTTEAINFSDANPGRPNGPLMSVEPGELVYPLSVSLQPQEGEETRELCSLAGNSLAVTAERPYLFERELDCALSHVVQNGWATTPNLPEKEVETAVASLRHEVPWYTLNFRYADKVANDQCNIFISASGAIKRGPEYKRAQCTPVAVSLSR